MPHQPPPGDDRDAQADVGAVGDDHLGNELIVGGPGVVEQRQRVDDDAGEQIGERDRPAEEVGGEHVDEQQVDPGR